MKIYDSFGTFNATTQEFNLSGQTTNIGTDLYKITDFYDISNTERYAILAILQTADGNETDFSNYPANCACMKCKVKFEELDRSYIKEGDKNIFNISSGEIINVIIHHGIGFDPKTNEYDYKYIKNYKDETYIYYPNGAKPGRGGTGVLI